MSKKTREERKAEESAQSEKGKKTQRLLEMFRDKTPEKLHCRRCKTLMEDGVCPTCGFRMYKPMSEKTQKTVRWIFGGICIVALIIVLILQQTK